MFFLLIMNIGFLNHLSEIPTLFYEIKKEGVVCCTFSELITTIKVRYVLGYVKLQVETHNLTNNNYLIPEASIPQNEGWK